MDIDPLKAALLIQQWHRRNLARLEVRRLSTWTIFQNLEYAGEQDQADLYKFFNALLTHMPAAAAAARARKPKEEPPDFETDTWDDDGPLRQYGYIEINPPLGRKDVDLLIDLFRKKKNNQLHPKQIAAILRAAAAKLQHVSNFNLATTSIAKQVTVVGDLHGKLDDLLVILYKNGLPSNENPYIFNGDFVDRGKKSLEVLLILLTLFLVHPNAVFLNRGNHEDTMMNARYGFIKEVQGKYPNTADKLLRLIDEVFRYLPFGSIINNRIFVVHGGISDTTNLDLLKSIDRSKFVSILRPPVDGDNIDKTEWRQIFDILWSDPMISDGCTPNTLRGAGSYFGPDVTDDFLKRNKFKCLIRSHECKAEGHEVIHNGNVITIFSASNYYATGSNRGAFVKLDAQLTPRFVQYISAASKMTNMTFREKTGAIENSALRELGVRLRSRRDELEKAFYKYDKNNSGHISVIEWSTALENSSNLSLPWRILRDKLAPSDETTPPDKINYFSTLELLDADGIIESESEDTSVADSLYGDKESLETIFHIIDKDNSGTITIDEFSEACDILVKYLPGTNTHEEFMSMCKLMDINQDGYVDLNEFLEAFRLSNITRQRQVAGRRATIMPTERRGTINVSVVAAALAKPVEKEEDIDPTDMMAKTLDSNDPSDLDRLRW